MANNIKIIGIDISKDVFDAQAHRGSHRQFSNNEKGFAEFLAFAGFGSFCVMEATSIYHLNLANFLHSNGISVSVVNPLVVKRFMQMHLKSNKTDKSDARMIALYGVEQKPELWSPPAEYIRQSRDLFELQELLVKQRTALKNRLHAVESKGMGGSLSAKLLKEGIGQLDAQLECIESELHKLIKKHEGDLFTRIQGIPGIGKKTALMLILLTDSFRGFETAGQVSSYVGLAPCHRQSGSSVRGRSRISKQGNTKIRNLLFMCSFTACRYNKACRELFERIVAKGKSKKLALIAVANKLIRQAFALAKSGLCYDEDFRSTRPSL